MAHQKTIPFNIRAEEMTKKLLTLGKKASVKAKSKKSDTSTDKGSDESKKNKADAALEDWL